MVISLQTLVQLTQVLKSQELQSKVEAKGEEVADRVEAQALRKGTTSSAAQTQAPMSGAPTGS